MTVEEQLSRAFAALDEAVTEHVNDLHPASARSRGEQARRPGVSRLTWRSPLVVGAAIAVAVVIGVVAGVTAGYGAHRPAPPAHHGGTPSPSPHPVPTRVDRGDTPSQGAAGAARDHVLESVAALPFATRVHPARNSSTRPTELVSAQGVWVLSTPTWPATGCYPAESGAGRRYDWCDKDGELLLLSPDRRHILRAYPLADAGGWLVPGNGSIYVGASPDTQPVAMLCRLPLDSLALGCRYFQVPQQPGADGDWGWTAGLLARWPGHNQLDESASLPSLDRLRVTTGGLVGTSPGQPDTRFDPVTLKRLR